VRLLSGIRSGSPLRRATRLRTLRGRGILLAKLLSGVLLLGWHPAHAADSPRIGYVALNVADEKRALDFYVGLMGMQERRRIAPLPTLTEILLGFGTDSHDAGVLLVLHGDRTKAYEVGDGFSRTIINVTNIDAVMKRLIDGGVKVTKAITEMKSLKLKYAMVKDPDGYTVELVQAE
jgi:lactoylglutathione lyase